MTITSIWGFFTFLTDLAYCAAAAAVFQKKGTGQSPVQNKKQPKLAHGHNGLKLCNMVTLIEPEWFSLTKKRKSLVLNLMKKGKCQCLLLYNRSSSLVCSILNKVPDDTVDFVPLQWLIHVHMKMCLRLCLIMLGVCLLGSNFRVIFIKKSSASSAPNK